MNLSSLIIRVQDANYQVLINKLNASGLCQCHMYENGKLIVTIVGPNTEEELEKLSAIKQFEEVITADLIYAYSENELEEAREMVERSDPTPVWLNKDEMDAKEIKYGGDVRK